MLMRVAAALLCLTVLPAAAQDFPSRHIELVVPSAAGAPSDIAMRTIAQHWQESLGKPIVISNKPGAGGAIAAGYVASARPDGYTLLTAYDSVIVALPFTQKNLPFTLDSFTYLRGYAIGPIYFMVRADSPWTDVKSFIEAARAPNANLTYGSYGVGVITHFTAERVWELAKVNVTYVPYKSSPETAQALLRGEVSLALTAGTGGLGTNPQVRMIGVAGDQRRTDYPNVPTLKAQGIDVSLDYIAGILAPKGLPPDIEAKLTETLKQATRRHEDSMRQGVARAEMSYLDMDGPELRRQWTSRKAWFDAVAPRLKLEALN